MEERGSKTKEGTLQAANRSNQGGLEPKDKKEGFPGIMGDIVPENSFPHICVVSVIESRRGLEIKQEYEGSVGTHAAAWLFQKSFCGSRSASRALAGRVP